jgi:hypothetical protein
MNVTQTALFVVVVLGLAGAGTWASVIGWLPRSHRIGLPLHFHQLADVALGAETDFGRVNVKLLCWRAQQPICLAGSVLDLISKGVKSHRHFTVECLGS